MRKKKERIASKLLRITDRSVGKWHNPLLSCLIHFHYVPKACEIGQRLNAKIYMHCWYHPTNKIVKVKPKLNYVFTYVGIIEH